MKFNRDNKYLLIGITAFAVIAVSLLFYTLITKWSVAMSVLSAFLTALGPVIMGVVIAYLLSPVVGFCESIFSGTAKRMFPKSPAKAAKLTRGFSVTIALLLVVAFLAGLILLVIPELIGSTEKLVSNLDRYFEIAGEWISEFTNKDPELQSATDKLINQALVYTRDFLEQSVIDRAIDIVQSLSSGIVSIVRAIVNFLVGIIVSAYLLYNKEIFIRQVSEFFKAFLPIKGFAWLVQSVNNVHKLFGSFLLGKILASLIVGLVTAVFLVATGMPYAPLISVLVAVTNVIPFIGPFIGAVPSAFLLLLESPLRCLIFVIFIIVLQQIDGNIISAKLLGASTGLNGFWVIFAIFIGGALFGFMGMVLGVPIFAVIYQAVEKIVQKRLKQRDSPDAPEQHNSDAP
jgi:predicted PurR-regulated permease PerM